ncbi:hypothetical protein EUBIFOR_00654 [Holdemanella biformis DSM 3989]|uniref:Uncharacterized protein n=1 Tax=Holdemanella biformis DSM 3989 TaxID=518637 RepID=B7C8Z8_9FIRM|nr:hypothetical protein EUBIFOR_00654 [Holdemanella biformis DSM 3989]
MILYKYHISHYVVFRIEKKASVSILYKYHISHDGFMKNLFVIHSVDPF